MSSPATRVDVAADGGVEFSELDYRFAQFLQRLAKQNSPELGLAAAWVSQHRSAGHLCLDLRQVAGRDVSASGDPKTLPSTAPEFQSWLAALRASGVVGEPGQFTPLVLDARGRLYLHRYWKYETDLAAAIRERAGRPMEWLDHARLAEAWQRHFPAAAGEEIDWQQVAVFTALTRGLCVICGGPGTGKTHTVAALLAILFEQAGDQPMRVALAAPTGRAAARLSEAIGKARDSLRCSEAVKQRLPSDASTLHRLLGPIRDSAFFKHHAGNPLPFDVVVVDEASMVDLALMAKLFDALAPTARVILLGDKDQLASVEAGAVLGDICGGRPANAFSEATRRAFRRVAAVDLPPAGPHAVPLADCIVELQKSHRFRGGHGIHALSQAVNRGDAERALEMMQRTSGATLQQEAAGGVRFHSLPAESKLKSALQSRVVAGFRPAIEASDARTALQFLRHFRILCAVRQGPFGVANVNRLAEEILDEAGLIRRRDALYAGRPVMILKNDYDLRLFNGDTGILMHDEQGRMRAHFLDADGMLRSVAPVRLPEHETAFAITVHKSQGSEFEDVLLMLPGRDSPVLTRELIYTGATRASRGVEVWGNEAVFQAAVKRRVERASGLGDALWR